MIHQLLTKRFRQCGNGSSSIAQGRALVTRAINLGQDPGRAIGIYVANQRAKGKTQDAINQALFAADSKYRQFLYDQGKGGGGAVVSYDSNAAARALKSRSGKIARQRARTDAQKIAAPLPDPIQTIKKGDRAQWMELGDKISNPSPVSIVGVSKDGKTVRVRPENLTPEQSAQVQSTGNKSLYDRKVSASSLYAPDDDLSGVNEFYTKRTDAWNRETRRK